MLGLGLKAAGVTATAAVLLLSVCMPGDARDPAVVADGGTAAMTSEPVTAVIERGNEATTSEPADAVVEHEAQAGALLPAVARGARALAHGLDRAKNLWRPRVEPRKLARLDAQWECSVTRYESYGWHSTPETVPNRREGLRECKRRYARCCAGEGDGGLCSAGLYLEGASEGRRYATAWERTSWDEGAGRV